MLVLLVVVVVLVVVVPVVVVVRVWGVLFSSALVPSPLTTPVLATTVLRAAHHSSVLLGKGWAVRFLPSPMPSRVRQALPLLPPSTSSMALPSAITLPLTMAALVQVVRLTMLISMARSILQPSSMDQALLLMQLDRQITMMTLRINRLTFQLV